MTSVAVTVEPGSVRGLRRVEYDALVATGLLDGEPVELLLGALVRMSPQDPLHSDAIARLTTLLVHRVAASGWRVRVQLPLAVTDDSEPEPDFAVVPDVDSSREHPSTAALVVEVSRSSRRMDLGVKAALYAAAGVPDYWVLDVVARTVHVHREPCPSGYGSLVQVSEGELRTSGPLDLTADVSTLLA